MGFLRRFKDALWGEERISLPPELDASVSIQQNGAPAEIPASVEPIVEQLQKAFPGADVQVETRAIDLRGSPERDQVVAAIEAATGTDIDGDGRIGDSSAVSGADDARLSKLERLAALRDSGALSATEFEAEKARVLGGSDS
jgi:hypothetical protein